MKKKIFGIFTFVIMMLSCICFSACSDKYEDFEFVVMYAYSADATEWINVDDEAIFNYGVEEDSLKIENGQVNIFFKVDIANVKEKHIDDIIVSKNGSTIIVKENQVFSISIPPTEMTNVKLYETNSGKSTQLSLGAYPTITSLEIKEDSKIPTMFERGDLKLTSLMNIEPFPSETKQTGVTYSVVSDNGEIVDGTTLRAKDNAAGLNNIIKVRATSIHNEEIYVEFDVVVLPTPEKTKVLFNGTENDASNFTLYSNSDYATTYVEVVKPVGNITVGGTTYTYTLDILIDGVPFDSSNQGVNGLLVKKEDNIVKLTAMDTKYSLNNVKFEWKIDGFIMPQSSPAYNNLTKQIVVNKRTLPNTVKVNNAEIEKDLNDSADIYVTNANPLTYWGLKLNLSASQLDLNSSAEIYIENANNLILKDADKLVIQGVNGKYTINSGDDVYFSFADQRTASQKVLFKVRKVPTMFNGEQISLPEDEMYASFEYTFNRKVTADSMVALDNTEKPLEDKTIYIQKGTNKNSATCVKLKVNHTSGTLNSGTIKLTINDETENVKFVNGLQEITLNHVDIKSENEDTTTIFTIPLICANYNVKAYISAVAGDESVGVSTSFYAQSVDTQEDGEVKLVSDDLNYFKQLTEEELESTPEENTMYLALIKGETVDFEVLLNGTAKGIKNIKLSPVVEQGFETDILSYPQEVTGNKFDLSGSGNGTQILNLEISYYAYNTTTGVVSLSTTTRRLEIAVCSAISTVYVTTTSNSIAYINSKYQQVSTVEVTFNSLYNPSVNLEFKNNSTKNVSAVKFYVQNILNSTLDKQNIEFYLVTGEETILLDNDKLPAGVELVNAKGENVLNGKIVIKLKGAFGLSKIVPTFVPMFFNTTLTPSDLSIENNANNYKKATDITFSGVGYNNLTKDPEINSTFLDVKDGGSVEVSFGAKAYYENETAQHYDDLDFTVYKLTEDESGNIAEAIYEDLDIVEQDGIVTISAEKINGGGYYKIVVSAKDSYDDSTRKYKTEEFLYFRLTDGSKENPYVLYNDNFNNINNNLKAYYVIGENIILDENFAPIGAGKEFEGGLSGTVKTYDDAAYISTQYSITLTVKESATYIGTTKDMLAGLFGVLGSKAEINDIKINANFDTENAAWSSVDGIVSIGALAGVNRGKISNVSVEIKTDIKLNNSINSVSEVNLGGLVGLNAGEINIGNSVVKSNDIEIQTNIKETQNIGLVAGRNDGTILGNYKEKADLNEIVYSVIANLSVKNSSIDEANNYNIAGVAGFNNGTISGVVIGGRIETINGTDSGVKVANGYLAGIAGTNNGEVKTNTVLALNLTSNSSSMAVAGVVGENLAGATVSDARVIAVVMDFGSFETTGKIVGAGDVAGAVVKNAKSEDGTKLGLVEWIGVESFLTYQQNKNGTNSIYYLLNSTNSSATVAGLIAENGAKLENSFVNANINANGNAIYATSKVLAGVTEENTYFIGKIYGTLTSAATYAVVVNDGNSAYTQHTAQGVETFPYEHEGNDILENKSNLPVANNTTWKLDSRSGEEIEFNYIVVDGTKIAFPYLVREVDEDNFEMFMIMRPTELNVWINEEYYQLKQGPVYVESFELAEDEFAETVIVNYFDIGTNNTEFNTYAISDLISKKVIPEDENVQGGIRYEIVAGGHFARIEQDSEKGYSIVFLDVSRDDNNNPTPIIVRCYSLFNNDIDKYVVFFTELGVTELELDSTSIVERDNEKVISTYVGGSSIVINVNAINKNENYKTVLDATNAENFLNIGFSAKDGDDNQLTVTSDGTKFDIGGILTINTNDWINSGLKISVNENADIQNRVENINLSVNLNMDLGEYSPYFENVATQTIAEQILKFTVAESAKDLDITVGGDAGTYQTKSNIGFVVDVDTSYVDNSMVGYEYTINEEQVEKYDKVIRFNENNKDSVRIYLDVVEDEFDMVEQLLSVNNCSLAELFEVYAYYVPTASGYTYHIELSLRDEFSVRYITNPFTLNVSFVADSNPRISKSVEITYVPTKVSTFRIENYSAKTIDAYTQYTELITKSNSETSIISPGGNGGVMVIYLSPSYAFVDAESLKIISDYVTVPSRDDADKRAFITFEQLIYNELTSSYEVIYPKNNNVYENADGSGRIIGSELTLATYKDKNENIHYDGVIYVHTMLEKFTGIKEPINVTFSANIGGENKSITKSLRTTYIPGTVLEYRGAKDASGNYFANIAINDENGNTAGYLIQNSTSNNVVDIKTYGYKFANRPSISFEWNLPKDTPYHYDVEEKGILTEHEFATSTSKLYIYDDGVYKHATVYNNDTVYYGITNKSIIYDKSNQGYSIYDYVSSMVLTDFEQAIENADGSYTIQVGIKTTQKLISNFSIVVNLTIANEDSVLTSESSINFYPTDFILRDVNVLGVDDNGVMNVPLSGSQLVELEFATNATNQNLTNAIYKQLLENLYLWDNEEADGEALKQMFRVGANTLNSEFEQFKVKFISFDENEILVNKLLSLTAKNTFTGEITFSVGYNYEFENGMIKLEFVDVSDSSQYRLSCTFTLNIYPFTTEENAIPIYTAEEFVEKLTNGANTNFILMRDIELTNFTPITTAIASLDGNNKVIKIKSFAIDTSTSDYGLFGSLGTYTDQYKESQKSILKNVVVDYSSLENNELSFTNNQMMNITFGGLVARNDGGLIYNCDVMNFSNSNKKINILMDNNSKLTFGGLVGVNAGVITNSRVGRSEFTKVSYDDYKVETKTTTYSGITFVIGNASSSINGEKLNVFDPIVGGFVGENSGIISSSYVANTSILSHAEESSGKLAGFAGSNTSEGKITYSYVRANDSTLSSTSVFNTGATIESTTDSRIAGFVYTNAGEINNAFANIELKTTSIFLAGFVDNNSGRISECYAAATMNGEPGGADISERPFIGVDKSTKVQNKDNGVIENCYYVMLSANKKYADELAYGLLANSMGESKNLIGFVFVLGSTQTVRDQGVWSYYTTSGMKTMLPELVSANRVAISVRVPMEDSNINENSEYQYSYVPGYALGTSVNPNIIRNAEEFNKVFRPNGTKSTSYNGYVRVIDNFSFSTNSMSITTRSNFVLGDDKRITSIDGNGMTVSGIYLDAESGEAKNSTGLFAEIKNSYVRNLNLAFINPTTATSTSNIVAVGGLAGRINNSAIINIDLSGDIVLQGYNMVGGLAGIITGKSMIYGISSSLNTKVTISSNEIYKSNSNELNYSYAGAIAGVLDIEPFGNEEYNVAYIDVYAQSTNANRKANVLAGYAGGVAGYAGAKTKTIHTKLNFVNTSNINGTYASGGLYGLCFGSVRASQVALLPVETKQYEIDKAIAEYIVGINTPGAMLDESKIGNTSLIESTGYAGGLVGVAVGASISESYAKVGFKNGNVVGGLVGGFVGSFVDSRAKGSITYSYAVPMLTSTVSDLGTQFNINKAGGLVGEVWERSGENNQDILDACGKVVGLNKNQAYANIQFTFSTVIMDKNTDTNGAQIDLLCPNYSETIMGSDGADFVDVYLGTVSANEKNKNISSKAATVAEEIILSELLDKNNVAIQSTTFDEVFGTWSGSAYWKLDNSLFYPILKEEDVSAYILIDSADDFKMLELNPDLNYMVIKDIDMTDWCIENEGENYILPITFKGSLVGKVIDDNGTTRYPKITGLFINATTTNEGAGFFKETQTAVVSGLEFVWDSSNQSTAAIKANVNLGIIGGVSALDINPNEEKGSTEGSTFMNLDVVVKDGDAIGHMISSETRTIKGFGGIVGRGINSTIMNCKFYGSVKAYISAVAGDSVYFGGLVAEGSSKDYEQKTGTIDKLESMKISGSEVGKVGQTFEITIGACANAFVGGAFGELSGVAVSNVDVNLQTNDTKKEDFKIIVDNSNAKIYIGGVSGSVSGTGEVETEEYRGNYLVSSCNMLSDITVSSVMNTNFVNVGGLIGTVGSGKGKITGNMANAEINLDDLQCSTLASSMGVALVSGEVELTLNLFNGSIIAEGETKENIYIGGAIGILAKSATISETLTNVVIIAGTTNTKQFVAGGLVGGEGNNTQSVVGGSVSANANIKECVSLGRIVPITEDDNQTQTYVGGFVGNASSITAKTSYSLTSIITDGVGVNSISSEDYKVNALFGKGSISSVEVYYSSDYALCVDNYGTNVSANTMLNYANAWDKAFVSGENAKFTHFENDNARYHLPYIKELYSKMVICGLISEADTLKYTEGTALNPIVDASSFGTDYAYYLAKTSLNQNSVSYSGELNGILIGADSEIIAPETYESGYDGNTTQTGYGIIPVVKKHSAVSNIHVRINSKNTITLNGIQGVVVGINNGVVFNSSVGGHEINISGNGTFGSVVGVNNGMVSSSFSTIEIVATNSVEYVSGVVGQNNKGMIMSSYFTGYINNTEKLTTAAGIVALVADKGYVYNSYMAGVVTNISTSSFIGEINQYGLSSGGSNNFMDNRAGLEEIGGGLNVTAKSTYDLVSNKSGSQTLLAGSWENQIVSKEGDNLIFSGYNFGYPVISLQKRYAKDINSLHDADSTKFHEYTGNGGYNTTANGIDVATKYSYIVSLATEKDASGQDRGRYYDNAIKIPHLGVLNLFTNRASQEVKNYILIYDIDGMKTLANDKKENLSWSAINKFKGVFMSNRYLDAHFETADNRVVVSNLDSQGLFSNIDNAFISDIKFSGTFNVNKSGVIGTNIIGETTIQNISFDLYQGKTAKVFTEESKDAYVGALVGEISANTIIKINNVITNNVTVYGENATVGMIAGKMTGGSLVITHAEDKNAALITKPDINYLVNNNAITVNIGGEKENAKVAGGIVGETSGGTISGATLTKDGVTVNSAVSLNYGTIYAENFGAVVGFVSVNGATLNNIAIVDTNSEILVENVNNQAATNYYGMVAAKVENCSLTVNNFILKLPETKEGVEQTVTFKFNGKNATFDETNTNQAVGGVVGKMNGEVSFGVLTGSATINAETSNLFAKFVPTIVSQFDNLGGFAGIYEGGNPKISGIESESKFVLKGQTNVGGVFGQVNGHLTTAQFVKMASQPAGETSFTKYYVKDEVKEQNKFTKYDGEDWQDGLYDIKQSISADMQGLLNTRIAEIVIQGKNEVTSENKTNSNFGGLFGILNVNIPVIENVTITNNNAITFTSDDTSAAKNIGGIAGKFVGKTTITVKDDVNNNYTQEITVIRNANNLINNVDIGSARINEVSANFRESSKPINVGGIFGYVSGNNSIQNVLNKARIEGYQNVGGYVGYYQGTGSETEAQFSMGASTIADRESAKVFGVVNVGGIFGYVNATKLTATNELLDIVVHGNTNVGAFAGLVNKSIVSNFKITNAKINAIYELILKDNDRESVIPRGVGSLCGQVLESRLLENNINTPIITSAQEGARTADGEQISTISTVSNYMHITNKDNASQLINDLSLTPKVVFDSISSGFGGFVGTIDYATLNQKDDANNPIITSNKITNLSINASLGINVGGFYGFVQTENVGTGEVQMLVTPKAGSGTFSINGAYNIGAVAGNVASYSTTGITETFNLSQVVVEGGEVQVDVQKDGIGMYVGGIFGKVSADNLKLTANNATSMFNITIHTTSSYYMGGLVGRWNATGANPTFNGYVGQDDVEETEIDERIVTDSSITSVVSAQEFGGMIGMLKVEHKGDESGATINVKGTHFYPFTVNTIENSNYNNSSSFMDYYYEEETGKENELFLVAHSVYSNLDKFNIVSSASGEVLAQDRISEHYAYHRSYGSNPEAEEFKFIENKMVELHEKFKNGTIQDFQISYDPYDLTGYDGGTDSMLLGTDEFEALQSKKYPDDFDGMLTTSPDRFLTEKEIYAFYTGTLYSKVQDLQTISSVEGYKDMGIIFTISYSLPGEEANNFANPFRPQDSIGWHKDFMGFRKLQRSIVQDNNDFGNSTAVLFDAGNIREIQIFDNNKIAYMIYERSENDVVLYARNVVAQLVVDQNGNIKNNGEFINKGNSIYNAESSTSFNSTEGLFVPGGNVFLLEKAGSEFNGAYFIVLRYNDEENKYLKSASMFSDYYTKKPIYTADQLIDKAEKYLDKGKYDKAQKFYSEADDLINKQYTILEHGNLLSAKTYAKLEDYSSVGALGYSYTRELMYQNNKLNTSNDSMINFSQSNYYGYLYYSDIRPNDYYSNYWLEFSEDKELNSYSIYQTPEGIQLQEKYYFYHGAYYIHPYAKDIVYRQSQDFFNELNYDTSALWEFRNGYYYTYEGDLYNNMFSNNGLNTEKYTEKIEQKYVYKESFDFNNYVEKYDYIKKNLYLTLETSGVQGASHVAELERLESISDDLEENIDYIAVNQGEFINYYNLATIGNFVSDKVGYDLCEYAKGNQDAGNVIYVNVYYTINAEQAIGKDSNSILNAIFVNAELFENIQETDIVITETQNFLYFEGGYKLQDGVLKGVVYDFDDETNEYVETLYDVSSKYLISHGIKDIEDGHLTYRDYLNKTDKEGKDGYNYNKFTTNEEYNFYTRYDFGTNFTQSPFLALNPVKGFMVNKKSINHLCYYDLYCCETEEGYEFIWKNAGIAEKTGWNVKKKNELELYYEDLGETDGKAKGEFDDIITISSEKQEYYREKYKVGLEYDVKNSETIDYNGKTYRQVCGEWKVLAQSGSPNFDIKTYFVESVSVKLGGFFISING